MITLLKFLLLLVTVVQFVTAIINTIDTFQFNEDVLYKCWKLNKLDGITHFKFNTTNFILDQELQLNISRYEDQLELNTVNPYSKKELIPYFNTNFVNENLFYLSVEVQGEYCLLFNGNSQYLGPFTVNFAIEEELYPIDVSQITSKFCANAIVGALMIVILVIKYNIKNLRDMSSTSRTLFVLLFLRFGYNLFGCFITNPSEIIRFETIIGRIPEYWYLIVRQGIYFGNGFKNLKNFFSSSRSFIFKLFIVLSIIGDIIKNPIWTNSVIAKKIVVNGEVQEVYLNQYNGFQIQNLYLFVFVYGVRILYGSMLIFCNLVSYIYGYIIYGRLKDRGQTNNAKMMKRTLLMDGIVIPIIELLIGTVDNFRVFSPNASILVLWWIWYSKNSHTISDKKYDDDFQNNEAKAT